MKAQITEIKRAVEIALNEVNPNEAAFVGDQDHADLMTTIESQIEAAVDQLHSTTPLSRMALDATQEISYDGTNDDPRFIYKAQSGVLTIILKSFDNGLQAFDADILRMVTARSKAWPFDVTNEIFPDDPLFAIVTDKYVGAQPDFPAVTHRRKRILANGSHKSAEVLELRCLEKASDWANVTFITKAEIHDGTVSIDSKLYNQLITLLTEKTAVIINTTPQTVIN